VRRLRAAIVGGGTGGHVFPALAVAEALRALRSSTRVLLIGSTRGLERRLDLWSEFETVMIDAPRSARSAAGVPAFCARSTAAFARAYDVLSRFRPHVVIGTGGYASAAPVLAAKALRRPVILLEQNVIPGRANRLLARLADEVHTQFEESVARFPRTSRVRVTGNPVRASVLQAALRRWQRPADGRFTLFVMGGSQGARSLNRAVISALPRLAAAMPEMRVFHAAGSSDVQEVRARLFASGLKGRAWEFCRIPEELYATADLVVFRAGATGIAELAVCGLPAILVPYPHAMDDHQRVNAEVLEALGACDVIDDADLDGQTFAERVLALARDPVRRARMSAAMREFGKPEAARLIGRRAEALAGFAEPVPIEPATTRRETLNAA
jgi:UDP-N-acetylglucosamine--N-acetylmuramyl-(pentapeptide) pyrophosphoryl-undecaprenol N-acetylglucosamine transferase